MQYLFDKFGIFLLELHSIVSHYLQNTFLPTKINDPIKFSIFEKYFE